MGASAAGPRNDIGDGQGMVVCWVRYQGLRAAIIITQLSVLFVVSGYNLWTVILCHGLYATIAFVRFARQESRYSKLDSAS